MRTFILTLVSAVLLFGAAQAEAKCPPQIYRSYTAAMHTKNCSVIRRNMNVLLKYMKAGPIACRSLAKRNYTRVKARYTQFCRHVPPPRRCTTQRFSNVNPKTRGVTYAIWRRCMVHGRPRYSIRVFGQCHPRDCDWGWKPAVRAGGQFKAFYNQGFVTRRLTIRFSGKLMRMHIFNKYNDSRGTKVWNYTLRRP